MAYFKLNNKVVDKFNALKATTLSGHFVGKNALDDSELERRHSKPQKYPHNVTIGLTEDRLERETYYRIREFAYKNIHNFSSNMHEEDDYDKHSEIMVVKNGPVVVGGARLTCSLPDKHEIMPMENNNFRIANYFADLNMGAVSYMEVSKVALMPEFSSGVFFAAMYEKMFETVVKKSGIELIVFCTYDTFARRVSSLYKRKGYNVICRDDISPEHFHIRDDLNLKFYVVDVTPDGKYENLLKQPVSEDLNEDGATYPELELA